MPEAARWTVTKSGAEHGFIYIPSALWSPEIAGQTINVICGESRIAGRADKKQRIWVGKQFMERVGLTPGTPVELIWRRPGELIIRIIERGGAPEAVVEELTHNQIRDIIRELGELKGRHAEVEYPIDNRRLDVVWKELPGGSPSEVFEVQIGGNIFGALVKLRYARALWPGAKLFLVVREEAIEGAESEARRLPEIADTLHIINCEDVIKLHRLWRQVRELENRCGL